VDAIVIGSGYGGSVTAARLAEAGLSVTVLERGPRFAAADLVQTDDLKGIQRVVDLVVSTSNLAFRTGAMVGGASINMDGAHFRMPRRSFELTDGLGRRYWPAAYDATSMAPLYARAEQMLGIRQMAWTEIPKAGGMFGKMLALAGASCERARLNYRDCLNCGFCSTGCIFEKKHTMLHTYLPLAEQHGAVVQAGAQVSTIEPVAGGYRVNYAVAGEARTLEAKRVVVACGGIHSAALLLRSRASLTRLSDQVGRNFNNNGEHGYIGILPADFDGVDGYRAYQGMDNGGLMSFHWYDSEGFTLHPGAGLEPSIFASAIAAANHPTLPARSWGMEYKRFVEEVYPRRLIAFSVLGLDPGFWQVTVKADGTPDILSGDRTASDAYLDRVDAVMKQIETQSGVVLVPATSRRNYGSPTTHLLSACRMADSAANGVVDDTCQVFGHDNLYVCDASSLPFALGVNPALTITAVAERAAQAIIARG